MGAAGVNAFTLAAQMIERHEGRRKTVYMDSVNIPTIGVGRNLRNVGLSDDEIDYIFRNDLNRAEGACIRIFPSWATFTALRQAAFMDMAFNLGEEGLKGFTKLVAAAEAGDWKAVFNAALSSKWAQQTGTRAMEVATTLMNG